MRRCLVPILLAGLTLGAPVSHAARVFYTDQPAGAAGSVISVAPDGTGQTPVITVTGTLDLRGIAWHRSSGRVFVLDNGSAKRVFSILPDGTGEQEVAPLNPNVLNADLEIDEAAGKLYWAEANPGSTGNGFILRANLDGSVVEPAVTTPPGVTTAPYFLFLDPGAGYIYSRSIGARASSP